MIAVKDQLEIVKGLLGYRYGDSDVDARVTDAIASQLASWGIVDIRNFGRVDDSLQIDCIQHGGHSGVLRGYHYVNNRNNSPLNPVQWTSFTGTGEYEGMSYGGQGGFWCGQYTNPNSEYTYEWDSRFDNYVTDAGRRGDFFIRVFVKFTDNGIPLFYAELFNTRGMKFGEALKELTTIVLAAATFAVPGVGAAISQTIFGPLAAAYPALTAAASNVMLNTALNGGDVEAAVKSVATSYLGQAAGGLIGGMSDSDAIGKLAAAATTAAIRGDDVERAVANAALQLAPGVISDTVEYFQSDAAVIDEIELPSTGENAVSIFDIPEQAPTIDWDPMYQASIAMPDLDEIASWAPATVDFGSNFDSGTVPLNAPAFEPIGYSLDDLFASITGEIPHASPVAVDGSGGALPEAIAQTPPTEAVDTPASSFFEEVTWDGTIDKLTSLAIAAVRVHQAYQAANRPPVQPAIQTTRAGGSQTARQDGTLTTTDPTTGRTVVTRPPAGVPYELPNGAGAVINNGNGTYTHITPDGRSFTRPYAPDIPLSGVARVQPESWVPGVPNWAILAGAAGLLAVIARR